jgi:hypothetical protein
MMASKDAILSRHGVSATKSGHHRATTLADRVVACHRRVASDSFTVVTFAEVAVSVESKKRPRIRRIPIVSK